VPTANPQNDQQGQTQLDIDGKFNQNINIQKYGWRAVFVEQLQGCTPGAEDDTGHEE